MDKNLINELNDILYLMIENMASVEQIDRLNKLMQSSSDIQQYVADYYYMAAALSKGNSIVLASLGMDNELNELNYLLQEMSEYEMVAPATEVEIEAPQPRPRRVQEVVPAAKHKPSINPYSFAITIISLAALLVMIAYLRIVPPKESVATLKDSIGAQWHGTQERIENDTLFYNTDKPRLLKKGIVEIEFDYGARVVIEGPSEFTCKSDNQITLTYGRLYARIPSRAIGFTVETQHSRIVDLGTEFGVQVNVDGTTELHVVKGLAKLLIGKMDDGDAFSVTEGRAKAVSSNGEDVKEIALKINGFIHQIKSKTNLIRKGQTTVDLADIAGGGNGFGTGSRNVSVEPVTGKIADIIQSDVDRRAGNTYQDVNKSPFIDGVFVPDGRRTQVVSSLGDVFEQCPPTQGNYYTGISVSPEIIDNAEIVLGGVNYSRNNAGSLFLHANLGITFDLEAIRSELADVRVARFRSTIGVCDSSWRPCNADFWILVDGQLRYSREKVQQKGILDKVEIELSENDRFLTLVTTDGGDSETRTYNDIPVTSMDSDWCLFAEPVLVLE